VELRTSMIAFEERFELVRSWMEEVIPTPWMCQVPSGDAPKHQAKTIAPCGMEPAIFPREVFSVVVRNRSFFDDKRAMDISVSGSRLAQNVACPLFVVLQEDRRHD
jgi:hypothetical protein